MWGQRLVRSWGNSLGNKIHDIYDTKKISKHDGPVSPRYKALAYVIWIATSERPVLRCEIFF